ncbi:MFS transporter, DHA1 family, bicyclomycin/chloramphenicol resistance protein [Reichenbachiella agariperforans]|uniref:MFS transporter, DHA1 family, bicyclomycin/chloramphenicol resistance protein n=1 Tax=Reichenbachiella agariperforans TaxID=156994 RepID=A0A1M6KWP1_REIAG|nr:multidrug effflux MFS transporter [Reichenbachiella agariperforans]SHJ63387.1 MFS transporter, DHA1 family, bicyclomycin/chloramphenicol resistance protein [Reichenbachiella agariperforans]
MRSWKIPKESFLITILLASLVTLSPFAIDTYLAAMPMMAEVFGVHLSVIELTITLYFLGFAIGNFIGGPLSDSFGRKTVALLGIGLYGLSSLLISVSTSIEVILVLRVLQAFGGGFATVTSNVFISDWYEGKHVARLVTITSMMMMLAPLIAPVLGAVLISHFGWESVFYFLFGFSCVLFLVFSVFVSESRDQALITRRLTTRQLFDKYKSFFEDRQSIIFLFSISLSMSGMYVFITSASFIYLDFFAVDPDYFPYLFAANIILNVMLSFVNTQLLKYYRPRYILRAGMLLQLVAGVILFVSVRLDEPSFWGVFGGVVLFIGSLGLVFGNGTAVILNHNPKVSSSANAAIGISRFVLGFLVGSVIALFHADDLVPVGTAMFLCTLAGNVMYNIGMRYKGHRAVS